MFLEQGRDESKRSGNEGRSGYTCQTTQDEKGVFVRHERDDQVEQAEHEEAPAEDGFRGVEVGYSAPEQEERCESEPESSLSIVSACGHSVWEARRGRWVVTYDDPCLLSKYDPQIV